MPCQENSCPKTHPISTVSRIKPREILFRRHFFHTPCFLHYSKERFLKYCRKRALQGREKSRDMPTYRVPKYGRHFVKFDDVTIYPVLVVARTGQEYSKLSAFTAEVHLNLSEIWVSLKRGWKGKKGFGTPPDSCPTAQWHPRLLGNCLECIYQFLTSNSNFKTTPNLQNFLFP